MDLGQVDRVEDRVVERAGAEQRPALGHHRAHVGAGALPVAALEHDRNHVVGDLEDARDRATGPGRRAPPRAPRRSRASSREVVDREALGRDEADLKEVVDLLEEVVHPTGLSAGTCGLPARMRGDVVNKSPTGGGSTWVQLQLDFLDFSVIYESFMNHILLFRENRNPGNARLCDALRPAGTRPGPPWASVAAEPIRPVCGRSLNDGLG